MSESSYYVGIEDPNTLRRNILESAKHSVAVLKSRKRINELRAQRHDKVDQLKQTIANMQEQLQTLTKSMPAHSKRSMPKSLKTVAKRIEEQQDKKAEKEEKEASSKPTQKPHKGTSLSKVHGIGPSRVTKLKQAGIHSAEDLASMTPGQVAAKTEIVRGMAQKLVDAAKELVSGDISFEEDEPDVQEEAPDEKMESEMDQLESKLADIERKLNNL